MSFEPAAEDYYRMSPWVFSCVPRSACTSPFVRGRKTGGYAFFTSAMIKAMTARTSRM
jgi:hypothetical protein